MGDKASGNIDCSKDSLEANFSECGYGCEKDSRNPQGVSKSFWGNVGRVGNRNKIPMKVEEIANYRIYQSSCQMTSTNLLEKKISIFKIGQLLS
ncbi:hypothetical protein HYC85_010530 [Camellia sinensis]|uniref:Uncharacterized protein n=1 Tax=Camellia sinensis TaxID=4442 RepID=A0A7J7HKW4_CAMSI|nr:hypothetical protein HYC85_010530 [Camellia sinensis]